MKNNDIIERYHIGDEFFRGKEIRILINFKKYSLIYCDLIGKLSFVEFALSPQKLIKKEP